MSIDARRPDDTASARRPPRTAEEVRAATTPLPYAELIAPDPPPASHTWWYPPGQYELGTLHHLVRAGFAANRHVDYSANSGDTRPVAHFRRIRTSGEHTVQLVATGQVTLTVDGAELAPSVDGAGGWHFTLPAAGRELEVTVRATGSPAALGEPAPGRPWESALPGEGWSDTSPRRGDVRPPHTADEPDIDLPLRPIGDGLYVLDAPVLGRPMIRSTHEPEVSSGESVEEALAGPAVAESDHSVMSLGPGVWTTTHRLGFRYLAVRGPVESVAVRANFRPGTLRGAFACSDPELSQLWSTSAYTLRLCRQRLVVDGVKRDRMPWAGDQALAVVSNAATVADAAIIRDGLVALGSPRHGYINGIADYSLWWVVAHGHYQLYFDDHDFLMAEADRLHQFVVQLARHSGEDGVLRPVKGPDAFEQSGPGAVFLDWGVQLEDDRDPTALQMLWFWALSTAGRLLTAAGHPGADRWHVLAARLRATLRQQAWDAGTGAWRCYLDEAPAIAPGAPVGYADVLAVLSGIHESGVPRSVLEQIRAVDVGTPFMRSVSLRALALAGDRAGALELVRRLWGPMVASGASTFWEEFGVDDRSPLEMYGRPFGKSLAHAWSSGPAALLPQLVLGVEPLAPGWHRFAIAPHLGSLTWAAAVVPAPAGDIAVSAAGSSVHVEVPAGCVLVHGDEEYPGPASVDLRY